jgi:hypothetical protein
MALIGYARVWTAGQQDESQHDLLTEAGCERIIADKHVRAHIGLTGRSRA